MESDATADEECGRKLSSLLASSVTEITDSNANQTEALPSMTAFRLFAKSKPRVIELEAKPVEYHVKSTRKLTRTKAEEQMILERCKSAAVDCEWLAEQSKINWEHKQAIVIAVAVDGKIIGEVERKKTRRGRRKSQHNNYRHKRY